MENRSIRCTDACAEAVCSIRPAPAAANNTSNPNRRSRPCMSIRPLIAVSLSASCGDSHVRRAPLTRRLATRPRRNHREIPRSPPVARSSRWRRSAGAGRAGAAEVLDSAVRVTCAGRTELARPVLLATGCSTSSLTSPASPTWGNQRAHLPVLRRLRAPRRAARRPRRRRPRGISRCCCASGPTTSSCSAMARTTSLPPTRACTGGRRPRHRDARCWAGQSRRRLRRVRLGDGQTLDRRAVLLRRLAAANDVARTLGSSCARHRRLHPPPRQTVLEAYADPRVLELGGQ